MALSENQMKYAIDLTEVVPVLTAVEGKSEIFPSPDPLCIPHTLTLRYSFRKK